MEESKQPLDFEVPHKRFCAYHCFGDKATEYLSCLKQPYFVRTIIFIREFGIRKGLKKLVISSKIRIFIGENQ